MAAVWVFRNRYNKKKSMLAGEEMMLRAIDKLEPFQKAISKAHLASGGVSIDSLDHKLPPLSCQATAEMRYVRDMSLLKQLAEEVKKGILEPTASPLSFNTVASCVTVDAQGIPVCDNCRPSEGNHHGIPLRPWWWGRGRVLTE